MLDQSITSLAIQIFSPGLVEDHVTLHHLLENAYCILNRDCRCHILSAAEPLANVASLFFLRKAMQRHIWVFHSSIATHNVHITQHT